MQRIGVLGGTFDPPHIGHLILAQYTLEFLELECVLFVPVGEHPFKNDETRTTMQHRLDMLRLAIANNAHFQISMIDVERPGPHYSADMIQLVQQEYPQAQLYFLMGGDNLAELPTWTRPRDIYKVARLAVLRRDDEEIMPEMHEDTLPGLAQQVDMVETPLLSIWLSSTHIVERLQEGKSVRYLVPDSVLNYIRANQLYADL